MKDIDRVEQEMTEEERAEMMEEDHFRRSESQEDWLEA